MTAPPDDPAADGPSSDGPGAAGSGSAASSGNGAAARDREHAGAALVVLRRRVDDHFEAAVAASPEQFACRAGCSDCCRSGLSVFAIEADPIREAIAALPHPQRTTIATQAADPTRPWCPLLVDGHCAVYEQRPLLCRSHGLAVRTPAELRDDPAQPYFDHCPLNYTSQTPPPGSILDLDALNQPLAVMARMWGGDRVSLAALAREGVPADPPLDP